MSAPVVDLAEVTETTDLVVEGHTLWVRPGWTEDGRYWQLLTPNDVRLAMVVERRGVLVPVFEEQRAVAGPSVSVTDVLRPIVTRLCGGAA